MKFQDKYAVTVVYNNHTHQTSFISYSNNKTRYRCKKLNIGSGYNFPSVSIVSVLLLCLSSTSVAYLSVKAISHQYYLAKQTVISQVLFYDHYTKWKRRNYWLSQSKVLQFQIIFSVVKQVAGMCQLELQ